MVAADFLTAMFGYVAGLYSIGGPAGTSVALQLKNHLSCKL